MAHHPLQRQLVHQELDGGAAVVAEGGGEGERREVRSKREGKGGQRNRDTSTTKTFQGHADVGFLHCHWSGSFSNV